MLAKNKSNGLITHCFNSTTLWIKNFLLKKKNKRGKKKLKSLFFRKNEVKTQNNDVKTCQNSNKNLNDNNHNYEIMINDELLIMDYEKAIKKNKRTWIKMYFHYISRC